MTLRTIADPFVVAAPAGARVRTRLRVGEQDHAVLAAVGTHLGRLASADLASRCAEGKLDGKGRSESRRRRKQALTSEASSRWAGAITRTSEDSWQLAYRNLHAEARSLRGRIGKLGQRLQRPTGSKGGYSSQAERWAKQQRLDHLNARLAEVEARLADGRVSVCRGGSRLAKTRHSVDDAGRTEERWRERWSSARWFITADGEKDKAWGNETIRWHPHERWLEIKLPGPLAHMANRPHGRYRLSQAVVWSHRGGEVSAQAQTGSVRYDIRYHAERGRWYVDASWRIEPPMPLSVEVLARYPVLAVDLNHDHLAAWVVRPDGNPAGPPITIPLHLAGLPASQRDGRLRAAISELIRIARPQGCRAIVCEDLDFAQAREEGREHRGRRPSHGKNGKRFRRLVAGIPTGKFRDRLTHLAHNAGLAVVAVDPAYTSRWGAEHWLIPLKQSSPIPVVVHHSAAVVIGRRALGLRARRRARCAPDRPEDRPGRATVQSDHKPRGTSRTSGPHQAKRQAPPRSHKTAEADRQGHSVQAVQDRSGPPTEQNTLLLSV